MREKLENVEKVEKALDDIRPYIRGHGGEVEVVGFEDGVVTVKLTGACVGCPQASATLTNGIEALLVDRLPEVKEVRALGPAPAPAGPATLALRRDHQETLAMLAELERAAASLPEAGPVPAAALEAIDRAEAFVAKDLALHFRLEDEVLFPMLGLPNDVGPLAQMAYEHEMIGILAAAFHGACAAVRAGPMPEPTSVRKLRRIVADLSMLLREHIGKEDGILFPYADRHLEAVEAGRLSARMASMRQAVAG
jgi:Fe-S cluster biogenesis protein NfuA/hemerythrin-like domain-containing protein